MPTRQYPDRAPFYYQGDIGTLIRCDAGTALSGASSIVIKYEKPDGVTGSWTASANGDYAEYTTQSDDLDVVGTWSAQIYVAGLSGWTGHGEKARFNVSAPIEV